MVYRARHVALKLILSGPLASEADARRFHMEAEAAAQLDHPHIVPIYDVGEHDAHPYFTMKLIDGESLAAAVPRLAGRPRDAARLIAKVARAVHYAHRRGILHRDLKPQNILVDSRGEPHVTDFGLPKRVDRDSDLTQSGAVMGTPSYMPPEQASGRRGAVTTTSDVYGLGAVFYELLTGRAPFRAGSVMETLLQVLECEAERPRDLNPLVPRDLETACLKCLEKDPGRQYPTAEALAEDLERWLRGESITARPTTAGERAWRWCRRNPIVAGLAASLFVVLAGAAGGSSWTAVRFRDQAVREKKARDDADSANRWAQRERIVAEANLRQAERNFALARDAVDRFFTQVSQERLLNEPHMAQLRKDLLTTAREFYERFVEERRGEPTAQAGLGSAYLRLADMTLALGQKPEARADAERARKIFEALQGTHPSSVEYRRGLAQSDLKLGQIYRDLGQTEQAEASIRRAIPILAALGNLSGCAEDRMTLAQCHTNLGFIYRPTGQRQAEGEHLQALGLLRKLVADDPDSAYYLKELAWSCHFLGLIYRDTARLGTAERFQREALTIRERLVAEHPETVDFLSDLAFSHNCMGEIYARTGRMSEALAAQRKALAIRQDLADKFSGLAFYRFALTSCLRYAGTTSDLAHRHREAEGYFARGLEVLGGLIAEHPDDHFYFPDLDALVDQFRRHYIHTRQPDRALAMYRQVRAIYDRHAARHSESAAIRRRRVSSHLTVAHLEQELSLRAEARGSFTRMRSILEALPNPTPSDLYSLACAEAMMSTLVGRGGSDLTPPEDVERRALIDEALASLRRAVAAGYKNPSRFAQDPHLKPLHSRAEFHTLLLDLSFPCQPFAPVRNDQGSARPTGPARASRALAR